MGGSAGRMKNIWEVREFTFKDLKTISQKLLSGEMDNVTEKLDGQNLMATWKNNDIRLSRNKTNLKNFGKNSLSIKELENKYDNRGYLQTGFVNAGKDLRNALNNTRLNLNDVFKEGEYWLNFEIIYTETENVIPYNNNVLSIHNLHKIDADGNTIEIMPDDVVDRIFKDPRERKFVPPEHTDVFKVIKTNTVNINPPNNYKELIKSFNSSISDIYYSNNLSENNTIQDYVEYLTRQYNKSSLYFIDDELTEAFVDRWAKGIKAPPINKLLKNSPDNIRSILRKYDNNSKTIVKKFEKNVESIFLKLSIYVLNNLDNLCAKNPVETKEAIQQKINTSLNKIKIDSDNNDIDVKSTHKILNTEYNRLMEAGGIKNVAPTEGIVFKYNDQLLKLTGSFSPINQIVGFYRYER